jgi:hypothetical protein
MYNIAFTGIVVVSIMNLVELDLVSQIFLQAAGVLWGSFFCSLAFVLPRLLEVNKERRHRRLPSNTISGLGNISGMSQCGTIHDDHGSSTVIQTLSFKGDDTSGRDEDNTYRSLSAAYTNAIIEPSEALGKTSPLECQHSEVVYTGDGNICRSMTQGSGHLNTEDSFDESSSSGTVLTEVFKAIDAIGSNVSAHINEEMTEKSLTESDNPRKDYVTH